MAMEPTSFNWLVVTQRFEEVIGALQFLQAVFEQKWSWDKLSAVDSAALYLATLPFVHSLPAQRGYSRAA